MRLVLHKPARNNVAHHLPQVHMPVATTGGDKQYIFTDTMKTRCGLSSVSHTLEYAYAGRSQTVPHLQLQFSTKCSSWVFHGHLLRSAEEYQHPTARCIYFQ